MIFSGCFFVESVKQISKVEKGYNNLMFYLQNFNGETIAYVLHYGTFAWWVLPFNLAIGGFVCLPSL